MLKITDLRTNRETLLPESSSWETAYTDYDNIMGFEKGWSALNQRRYRIDLCDADLKINKLMPEIKLYGGRRSEAEGLYRKLVNYSGKSRVILNLKSLDFQEAWKVYKFRMTPLSRKILSEKLNGI